MAFPILVSYAYARKDIEPFKKLACDNRVQLLLDSGAFTAKNAGEVIQLEDYLSFLDTWGDRLFRYLALDVVGDPIATDRNLREMLRRGYKPVPVHVLGDDQRRMDQLFQLSDYVALAGLRRPHKGGAPKEYVAAKMKWAAGRPVHWLGYVREPMIAAFQPYSCDSASWMSAALYGQMTVYLGAGQWRSYQYKDAAKIVRDARVVTACKQLGYTIKDIQDPMCWRLAGKHGFTEHKFMSFNVSAVSWMRYVRDIKERWGTRVFLATTMKAHDMHALSVGLDLYGDDQYLANDRLKQGSIPTQTKA